MSDQIRAQVESMVSCASISYSARYVTQTKRDDWNCDACRANTDKLRQVFTRAQIDALAEALREY